MSATSQSLQAFFAPSPKSNWTRRAYHASVVIDDHVYIDMGEVAIGSQPYSASIANPTYVPFPINCTLTLPIGRSWADANNVQYRVIQKPSTPIYDFSALWYDESTKSLYSYGGEESYLDTRPVDLAVWKLQLDGRGGGTWTQNTSFGDPPFSEGITRPLGGAATFNNNSGFYLGGYSSSHSSPATQALTSFVSTPGLIEYSFKDHIWSNHTAGVAALSETGAFEWGGLEHIPLGPNGLLVMWGGETSNSTSYFPGVQERPMDTVTLLDPVTKIWYNQSITGTPPSARNRFCSFVAKDPSPLNVPDRTRTAEIYMYGGYAGVVGTSTKDFDEIWVLSIPAFTWQRVDASQKNTRIGHTCHLVGGRQMLSIGGVDVSQTDWWSTPDYTNLNGIGVYDLVAEKWTTGYNATAALYQRSPTVQRWYDKNGPYPQTWTQPSLANLLIHNKTSPPSSTPTNLGPVTTPTPTPSALPSSSPSPITKAIIAGTTVGITLSLLIPFLLIFIYLRRKAAQNPYISEVSGSESEKFELPGKMDYNVAQSSGGGGRSKVELAASRDGGGGWYGDGRGGIRKQRYVVELDGGDVAKELYGARGGGGVSGKNSSRGSKSHSVSQNQSQTPKRGERGLGIEKWPSPSPPSGGRSSGSLQQWGLEKNRKGEF